MIERTAGVRPREVAVAAFVDTALVIAFVLIGRRNHDEAFALSGFLHTLWPFAVGLGSGWLVSRAWRSPLAAGRAGLPVWVCTVGVGLALRALSGQGTAVSFMLVTAGALGVALIGWRLLARLLPTRRPGAGAGDGAGDGAGAG